MRVDSEMQRLWQRCCEMQRLLQRCCEMQRLWQRRSFRRMASKGSPGAVWMDQLKLKVGNEIESGFYIEQQMKA